MDEITFYSFRHCGGKQKKQIFITINCENKSYKTNEDETKFYRCVYGFSVYELKDYDELKKLERWLNFNGFKKGEFDDFE